MTWAPLVYACDIEGREYDAPEYNGYFVTEQSLLPALYSNACGSFRNR